MGKRRINLREKLHADDQLLQPALIGKGDKAAQLRIQEAEDRPHFLPQPCRGICGICIAFPVMLRQDIGIQRLIPPLQFLHGRRFQPSLLQKRDRIVYQQQEFRAGTKVAPHPFISHTLSRNLPDSGQDQIISFL